MTTLWLRGYRVVLVDEVAEQIVTFDVESRGSTGNRAGRCGNAEVDASVWALSVAMADVLPKSTVEVTAAENEQPVAAFGTHRPHQR